LASYYRRFVENFSKISKPLTDLTKKDKKFVWSPQCDESFNLLKAKLTSTPVLVGPDTTKPFQIFCDASLLGLGAILMQDRQVVAYASRQLNPHEKNCSAPGLAVQGHPICIHSRSQNTSREQHIIVGIQITSSITRILESYINGRMTKS
jgi:hypothetical protein